MKSRARTSKGEAFMAKDGHRNGRITTSPPDYASGGPHRARLLKRRNYYGKPRWQQHRQRESACPSHVPFADSGQRPWVPPLPRTTLWVNREKEGTRKDRGEVGDGRGTYHEVHLQDPLALCGTDQGYAHCMPIEDGYFATPTKGTLWRAFSKAPGKG